MSKPAGMKRYDLIVTKSYEHPDGTWVRADDPAILAAIEALEAVSKRRHGRWMPKSVYDTVDRAISQLKGTA